MALARFSKMRLAGLAVVVPDNPRRIEEDLDLFDGDPAKLARAQKVIGFGVRYVGTEGITGADLCVAAARRLAEGLALDLSEIDVLICAIQKPDHLQPGPSFTAHRDLGLPKSCAVLDINHGCSGFVYALWLAGGLLEGGAARKIMILAGEHHSYPPGRRDGLLFGDAGSAALVEYDPAAAPSWFNVQADGRGLESLVIPAGGARLPLDHDLLDLRVVNKAGEVLSLADTYMDGLEVFHFTIREVPPNVKALLDFAGLTIDDIDFLASHQANKQIVEQVAARLGLGAERCSSAAFSAYGNQGPASIPGVLSCLWRQELSSGRRRVLMSGFGIGTAWGSAVMDLEKIYCRDIFKEKLAPRRDRAEEIAYWTERLKK